VVVSYNKFSVMSVCVFLLALCCGSTSLAQLLFTSAAPSMNPFLASSDAPPWNAAPQAQQTSPYGGAYQEMAPANPFGPPSIQGDSSGAGAQTSPRDIPQQSDGSRLGIYDQTPFTSLDGSYTAPSNLQQQVQPISSGFDQQNQQQSASNGSSNGKFGRDVDTALTSLVDNLAIGPNSTASQSGSSVDWSGNKPFGQAAGNTYAQSSMTPQAPPNFGAMPQQQHQQQQQPWMQPMGGYGMPQQGMYNPYGMQPTPGMYGQPQAMPPMYGGGMGQQQQNPFPSNGMPGGPPPQQQYGQQFPPQQPQQQSKDPFAF
jgi:hypothetical protein